MKKIKRKKQKVLYAFIRLKATIPIVISQGPLSLFCGTSFHMQDELGLLTDMEP